jgi:hypothetical protein
VRGLVCGGRFHCSGPSFASLKEKLKIKFSVEKLKNHKLFEELEFLLQVFLFIFDKFKGVHFDKNLP